MLTDFHHVEVQEIPRPVCEEGEALIKVAYAGICGSDVHVFEGKHATARPPIVMGHEFCGVVEEVRGKDGAHIKVGDRVAAQPIISCNACDQCVQGRENLCDSLNILGIHSNGCFAEYVKMPIRKIYPLAGGLDMRLAVLAEPLAVAVHDVRRSGLAAGQTALVVGGGPIGALIALLAKNSGASLVAVSEPNESRAAFIADYGFTVINPAKEDAQSRAMELTGKEGFDVVFEVSGTQQGAALMTCAAKKGGCIVLVGFPRGNYSIDTSSIVTRELRIEGVRVHAQINFAAAVDILGSGALNGQLERLITNEFALDDVAGAIKFSIEDQKHFKVILKV